MRERRSDDGGCGNRERTARLGCGMARPAVRYACRSPGRRGRSTSLMVAGIFRRRDRRLLSPEGRAPLVAWHRCGHCRCRLGDRGAPASRVVRSGARIHYLWHRLCLDAGNRLGARGADAAAPPRADRGRRTGCRYRFDGEGLAHRDRRRSVARRRCERSAAPSARAYSAEQRRAQPGRPRQPQGEALSGARADLARRARLPARALFRRHRRGRLHLWRRASGRRTGERRRVAREFAAASHRDFAADQQRPPRINRRGCLGADYR